MQSVSATWTVPSVTGSNGDAYSSCWIGIGGEFDSRLIQVGTEQDFTSGAASYHAWYEMLPATSVTIDSIRLSPGDQVQASISQVNSTQNTWSLSLTDLTNHGCFQSDFSFNSRRLTAKWIGERPEINGGITPLANFGSVTFTNCQATLSGKTGSITSFNSNYVTLDPEMINGYSVQLVDVSHTSNAGTQFTVRYQAT